MDQLNLRLTRPSWRTYELSQGLGTLHIVGRPSSDGALVAAIRPNSASELRHVGGHWAALWVRANDVVIVQDTVRSFPVFFTHVGGLTVSDDFEVVRHAAGWPERDTRASTEFLHLGFVTGRDTLFQGIFQTQLGEVISLDHNGIKDSRLYRLITHDAPGVSDQSEVERLFEEALEPALDRAFQWIGDRQVVIPLSGGLDSRLLAVKMRERGVTNLVNFTYGVGPTREVAISRTVAKQLEQQWEFIQYSPEEIRAAWASAEAGSFIRDSWAGASLPHIQDWYAILQMRKRGVLADDAVFIPGHTIVGNMHDEQILDSPIPVSPDTILDLLIHHHASIQPSSRALIEDTEFSTKVSEFITHTQYDGSPVSRLNTLESWNLIERQTKYINNSVRGYEHFGYEWALPMLDVEISDMWPHLGILAARDRSWYYAYVDRLFAATAGVELGTFDGFAATHVGRSTRDGAKALLRAIGLLTRVERGITARAVANHPMAFQEYIGETTPEELRKFIMRGGAPMGIYTERFLADTWNPHARVFID